MERRRLLIGTGATAVTVLAGCLGSDDDEDGSESESASHTEEQDDDTQDDDTDASDDVDDADDGEADDDPEDAEDDSEGDVEDDEDDGEGNVEDDEDDGAEDDEADSDDEDTTVPGIDDERLAATLEEHDIQLKTYTYEDGTVDLTLLTEAELANEIANNDGSPDETWAQEAQEQLEAIAASLDESITDDSEVESTVDSVRLTVLDEASRPMVKATIAGNDLVNGVDESVDPNDAGIDGLVGL